MLFKESAEGQTLLGLVVLPLLRLRNWPECRVTLGGKQRSRGKDTKCNFHFNSAACSSEELETLVSPEQLRPVDNPLPGSQEMPCMEFLLCIV